MPQTLLFCDLDLQCQGHWWSLKGQILAIFSHFGQVLIYRKLDHPMAGIYNTYICPIYVSMQKFDLFGDIFTLNADYIAWKLLKIALEVEYMMEYQHPVC